VFETFTKETYTLRKIILHFPFGWVYWELWSSKIVGWQNVQFFYWILKILFFSWCFNVGAFTNYTKKKNSVSFKGPNYNEVYDESQIHFGFKLHQMPFPKCYVQSQGVQELFVKCVNSHYFDLVMRNWVSNSLEFCYCKMEITT
jgi:hypothetical protein